MPRILVTGGCGFAGSHIVEELLKYEDVRVTVLDNLSYAARLDNLAHVDLKRLRIVCWDFRNPFPHSLVKILNGCDFDHIIHNGAQSHVARSFQDPREFVESNII